MNDQVLIEELTDRLREAAATADVSLPSTDARLWSGRSRGRRVRPAERRASTSGARQHDRPPQRSVRWIAIAAAVALLVGGVVFAGWNRTRTSVQSAATPTATSLDGTNNVPGPNLAGSTAPVSTAPGSTVFESAPESQGVVEPGPGGEGVRALEERLSELGYTTGPIDDEYDRISVQAVRAFKTVSAAQPLDAVTDSVTQETWSQLQQATPISPRRPDLPGVHIEIYLPEQAMAVFRDGAPIFATHISSGELDENGQPAEFCEEVVIDTDENGDPQDPELVGTACGRAKTPGGVFRVHRMESNYYQGPLGGMLDPIYFNYMIAIHGAINVPVQPSSHGGVRTDRTLASTLQTLVSKGDRVLVWNGEQEPEDVSEEDTLPAFDRFIPNQS